jgi:nicotinate-nucleotide adenylyltransferase
MVPMGHAPHRDIDPEPGPEVRLELCRLAAEGTDWLSVSGVEIERDGPSYTADTLGALAEAAPDDQLTLILGADQAANLRAWHEPEEVLRRACVAVAAREGMEREAVLRRLDGLGETATIVFFDMPRIDISSTLVRERIAEGNPIRFLVPEPVAGAVEQRDLYRAAVTTP